MGIDTVKLNGEGFEALVESGQEVKKGDPMLKLDLDYLSKNAPSIVSPVLCTELEDNQRIHLLNEGQVKAAFRNRGSSVRTTRMGKRYGCCTG